MLGTRPPTHGGNGRVRITSARDEGLGDLCDPPGTHQDHERAAGPGERVPVDVGAVLGGILVTGHDREVRRHAAVRHRDARVGGRRDRARDAGDDLERHAGRDARFGFLAAASEHERVAALQAHDRAGRRAARDEQGVDLVLAERGAAGRLADVDELSAGPGELEERRGRQPVVDDDVGGAQQELPAAGQQARIPRPGADEVHGHDARSSGNARRNSSEARRPTAPGSSPSTQVRTTT